MRPSPRDNPIPDRRHLRLPVAAAFILVIAAAMPDPAAHPVYPLPSICPLHALTGVDCPGCGMGRGLVTAVHGHVTASIAHHPAAPLSVASILLISLRATLRYIVRDPQFARLPTSIARWGGLIVLAALFARWLIHSVKIV